MMHILNESLHALEVVSLTPGWLWQPARGAGAAVESCGAEAFAKQLQAERNFQAGMGTAARAEQLPPNTPQ